MLNLYGFSNNGKLKPSPRLDALTDLLAFIMLRSSVKKSSAELKRRIALLAGISLVGTLALTVFGILALMQRSFMLGVLDITLASVLLINLHDARHRQKYHVNITLGVTFTSIFYIHLYINGGVNQTAYVWYFTYPLIASFLLGSKRGAIVSGLMTVPVLVIMLTNPTQSYFANYGFDFEIRFLCSYLVVSVFSFFIENAAEKNRTEIKELNENLEHLVKKKTVELSLEIDRYKKAESELRDSEERFRLLINQITDALFVSDHEGNLIDCNPQAYESLGYTRDELLSLPITAVDADFIERDHGNCFWKKLEPGGPMVITSTHMRKDGTVFPVEINIGLIEYKGQKLILGLARDITERKRAEVKLNESHAKLEAMVNERTQELKKTYEQLLHAEKLSAIGGLSASIAHEFNNPLQGIMTVIKDVKSRASLNEEDVELVDMAIRECGRMKDLILSLQDFNRPTSGRVAPMDIHSTVESLLLLSKKEHRTKGITIETNYAEDMPKIKAVADQIKQVVLNLLNNAVYACEAGGTITINTEVVTKKNITIKIQNTGKGIKPGHMGKIFDPFFTTKPEIKGTGLGLSISYGIIKKHGGRIDVKSEPGRSTTFTITLPIEGVRDEQ